MKTEEQRRARAPRPRVVDQEIERSLGVSRSSVSHWVRDVSLTPEQRSRLAARIRLGPLVAGERTAAAARAVRSAYQQEGRLLARERDGLYTAGCMLYWAEGAKRRNSARVTNSDPMLLTFFARFLREQFGVADSAMVVSCNLFADHLDRQFEIEQFWLTQLGLPAASLRKSVVNVYSKYSLKKRANKLPYGTCVLTVYSTRIVQTIYGSIQEYGGFDRPEWLD